MGHWETFDSAHKAFKLVKPATFIDPDLTVDVVAFDEYFILATW